LGIPRVVPYSTYQTPQDVKNAWAKVKIDLITSNISTPHPATITPLAPLLAALEKVHCQLTLIEKRIPAAQDAAKPTSYADAACQPPSVPQAPPEKFLPSRVLREVTVHPLAEPKPTQTSEPVVEAITRLEPPCQGKLLLPDALEVERCLLLLTATQPKTT
jgi:hypothetical protein